MMLFAAILLVTAAPTCDQPTTTLLSGEHYEVSAQCEPIEGHLNFTVSVTNLRKGGAAVKQFHLSFRGDTQSVQAPRGWRATRKSGSGDTTIVEWKALPDHRGVLPGRTVGGFVVKVAGPDAGHSCDRGLSFDPYEGGVGEGVLQGCTP
jgi:hypothetical protein